MKIFLSPRFPQYLCSMTQKGGKKVKTKTGCLQSALIEFIFTLHTNRLCYCEPYSAPTTQLPDVVGQQRFRDVTLVNTKNIFRSLIQIRPGHPSLRSIFKKVGFRFQSIQWNLCRLCVTARRNDMNTCAVSVNPVFVRLWSSKTFKHPKVATCTCRSKIQLRC